MSKSGKDYVYYNPSSSIKVNGQDKAGVNITNTGTTGYYNMDADEKKAYDYASKEFALNLPELNVFSADTQRDFDNQVQAFINQGVDEIKDIYTPMLQDLQNDIASRFGNLDNSVFMDNLSEIEDKRAEAVSDLVQSVQSYKQDLINNELANRYEYLDYLNNYRQQIISNILNTLSTGQNLSNTANSYYSSLNGVIANSNKGGGYDFSGLIDNALSATLTALTL